MKYLTISSLLIFISIFAYSQSPINQTDMQGQKQGVWEKRTPEGKLIYKATFKDDKPVGKMLRYHHNGRIKAELVYAEQSDTVFATIHDEKGKKIAVGNYINQKKEGEWTYFSNGRINSVEAFKDGIKNGISKRYYNSGELLDETTWTNGLKEGLYKAYSKNGKIYMQCMYKNNLRDGWCIFFYPNGQMELEAFYKYNLRQGSWNYYNEDGSLSHSLEYDNAILLNPEVRDSVQSIELNAMQMDKDKLIDPEKFMQNPGEYIMKDRMAH